MTSRYAILLIASERKMDSGLCFYYSRGINTTLIIFDIKNCLLSYKINLVVDRVNFSVSACPKVLAAQIVKKCAVDPFCIVGRVVIQLARMCLQVISIAVDPAKVKLARLNATAHEVADRIDFLAGDNFETLSGAVA